ncbi:hypothetical protein BDQ17DRAFT_1404729 [Cyathus striatus]|nr:hypothetical protein BDQ17DRAFT_1404729 [Cyathus striatus]
MSLASFLLNSAKKVDSELDSLFKSTPTPISTPANAAPAGTSKDAEKKRKLGADDESHDTSSAKRAKSSPTKDAKRVNQRPLLKRGQTVKKKEKKDKKSKAEKKSKGKSKQVEEDSEDDINSDLENAYHQAQEKSTTVKDADKPEEDAESDAESNDEVDLTNLVHESLAGKEKKSSKPKIRFIPVDETQEQKDRRTIFVGNLPLEVAQKRPLLKQLQKHILALVPSAKIESTRFRSVPFQAPTSKLPTSDDEDDTKKSKPRQHDLARTSAWRVQSKDEEDAMKDDKKFLSKNQKKKIAFISQEFHSSADSVNAYIVFAHPVPVELQNRAPNVPPPKEVMDPYDAALEAVEKGDGTIFMERLIRVDLVGKSAAGKEEKKPTGVEPDPKLSIFVGNLDFASKEEDLRVFFEGVVSAELGPPPEAKEVESEDGVKKPKTWVTRVRIVRDRDTQLGKGFAYIQFADRECVDEILSLEETKLRFAKRKLRVERCKTLPGASSKTSLSSMSKSKSDKPQAQARPTKVDIPKGDPALGEKIASLSKEDRKKVKSADADRVARRLAKKKARMSMGPKVEGGERKRDRKDRKPKEKRNTGRKEGGKRVRSEKSAVKRNVKK